MREAQKREYVVWLGSYRLGLVGVLTLRPGIRMRTARRLVNSWFSEIAESEGHPISWVAIPELGDENDTLHYHCLVAGIASRIERYIPLWEARAGFAKFSKFNRRHRGGFCPGLPQQLQGISYALKSLNSDDYQIELQLHDQHLLPSARSTATVKKHSQTSKMHGGYRNRDAVANDRKQ
ncbi:MAG TPA: hypothetical protein VGM02_09160 [Acidobacteriaceae bacterium]|jgi:hypothetical protein